MIISSIGQGFLWSILGVGIFLTFRILNFPDMTTEGSFPLGGAVCVTAIVSGYSPFIATIFGILSGMIAGFVTGILFTKGKIPVLLAGILVMSALNSVMLFVMKTPNLSLLNQPRIQDYFNKLSLPSYYNVIALGLIILGILLFLFSWFFHTSLGQAYIATGDNERMARSLGIHTDRMKIMGLVLSNGIIALAGAFIAQNDGYADINKGTGVIVIGLASIIIGEVLYGELSLLERLFAIIIGSIIYQLLILLVLKLGFDTTYLKLFSAIVLTICLLIPQVKKSLGLTTGLEKEGK